MSIKVRTILSGKIAIIDLRGALVGDEDTEALRSMVVDFIEQGNKCLVVNMAKVSYLNSSGVGALIAAHTSYVKNGGEVRLAGLTPSVQNLLMVTRLIDVFEVYDDVEDAITSFTQKTKSVS